MTTRDTIIRRGYEDGNYVNAYETDDFDLACEMYVSDTEDSPYYQGFLCGFFGSYTLEEVPSTWRADLYQARIDLQSILND